MSAQNFKLPTFLIIGAARSGTTTLYEYLDAHPEVFVSELKEPCFFGLEGETLNFQDPKSFLNKRGVTRLEDYQSLFTGAESFKAVGEASTLYLYSAKAAERIKHYLPGVKLIVILRNPAERAYSNFIMNRRDGRETETDFLAAFNSEEKRIQNNWGFGWHYRSLGFYHEQLARYYALFPAEQMRIYLFDDLVQDADKTVRDMYQFIGVDENFLPEMDIQANTSGVPKSEFVSRALNKPTPIKRIARALVPEKLRKALFARIKSSNLEKAPKLDRDTQLKVLEVYREDILRLQDLIGRDLSAWLKA
jgi:hypothetical protein